MKKRLIVILAAVAMTAAAMALSIAPSSAASIYDGKSPYRTFYDSNGKPYRCADSMTVISANYLRTKAGTKVGAIQLRKSTRCHTYWAYTKLYFTAQGYMTGHAELQRFYYSSEAGRWDCEDPGGNGDIVAGQSSCHTGMIYANSSAVTFYAWGYAYDRASYYADGQTARTR